MVLTVVTPGARSIRRAVTGLCVALLILTGCTGPNIQAGGSDGEHARVTETRAVHVDPFTPEGRPAPDITVVDEAAAKCSASGVNLSDPDARRCMTTEGYFLYDPCFVRHHPRPDVALCLQNPTKSEAVRIRIVEDEPRLADQEPPGRPWFLELADGRHCVPAPSTAKNDPPGPPTYTCGSDDHLYGMPDTRQSVWTITDRVGGADDPRLEAVPIRTAWL